MPLSSAEPVVVRPCNSGNELAADDADPADSDDDRRTDGVDSAGTAPTFRLRFAVVGGALEAPAAALADTFAVVVVLTSGAAVKDEGTVLFDAL